MSDAFDRYDRSEGLEREHVQLFDRYIYTEPTSGDWFGIDARAPLAGQLDELLVHDVMSVHLERMTDGCVWIGIDTHRKNARYSIFLSTHGPLDCRLEEWPEQPPPRAGDAAHIDTGGPDPESKSVADGLESSLPTETRDEDSAE